MKWEPKHYLFALFLCMGFTLVVGYGMYLFGDYEMKTWEKIVTTIMFVAVLLCVGISIIGNIWSVEKTFPKKNPTITCIVDDSSGCNTRTLKIKIIKVDYEDQPNEKLTTQKKETK